MSKQESASFALLSKAEALGPGGKLPTFRELQEELGISRTTLATVLASLQSRGVLDLRHGVGIFVSPRLAHRSFVLLCDARRYGDDHQMDPFWSLLVREAEKRAIQGSESLTLQFLQPPDTSCHRLSESLLDDLEEGRVDGILAVDIPIETVDFLTRRGVPVSGFACYAPSRVELGTELVVRPGLEALKAAGCRTISCWTLEQYYSPGEPSEVEPLLLEALAELGLEPHPAGVVSSPPLPAPPGAHLSFPPLDIGAEAVRLVFDNPSLPRPDGILILQDTMTRGALPALIRRGIIPGRDVVIASHSNAGSPLLYGFEDLLILVEYDPALLAREMFRLLETQIASPGANEAVVLPPVVRSSLLP